MTGHKPAIFIPTEGQLPDPDDLKIYAAIDPTYPAFFQDVCQLELKRNYAYQMAALIGGWVFSVVLVAAFVFLVYTGHNVGAGAVIGVNVLGVAGKLFAKARRQERAK